MLSPKTLFKIKIIHSTYVAVCDKDREQAVGVISPTLYTMQC